MLVCFLGSAGGEVTGSATLVESQRGRVLVDCGMFQGGRKADARNRAPFASRQKLDAVLLTHAHLDHSGRLPMLVRAGEKCRFYGTPATNDLVALILRDAARLMAQDAERQNRKRQRSGQRPVEPPYTVDDAEEAIARLTPAPYNEPVEVAPGIRACFTEAGHLLGSSSIQVSVDEEGRTKRVVFSGDLGPKGAPILKDYEPFHEADAVVIESTYGDREHRPFGQTVEEFTAIVHDTVAQGGKMLMPTFSVGRAQVMTMLLAEMFRDGKVKPFPVFLDSPMAIEATRITMRHPELFDDEMSGFLREGNLEADLKTYKATQTVQESMEINQVNGPCLVMAGAGMCTGGRILHHLKHNLWRNGTHVLFVGYQAAGSLGRMLVQGAKTVTIHGEKIAVRAQVHTLGGFSAHAGQKDLLAWLDVMAPCRPKVLINHGEDEARKALRARIQERHGLTPELPDEGTVIHL